MKNKTTIIAVLIILVIGSIILGKVCLQEDRSEDITIDMKDYEEYLGKDGKYKEVYGVYNDIFPDTIPDSAEVEEFCSYCYQSEDTYYLGYLVYTCGSKDYRAEYERLKSISSTEEKYLCGAKEFPYELCAVYADSKYGYIYALADEEEQKFIYVQLQFADGYTEIDYDLFIAPKYLPVGFEAK